MARIRTVKPEFWEDETIATLSRDARLLFVATFNLADDEGLLRWAAPYIKASAFMYDHDLGVTDVELLMKELVTAELIWTYTGGKAQQRLAFIVNFRKHQKINRPQPSKLPHPGLQNPATREMYARRDGWVCHLCSGPINNPPRTPDHENPSIDHLIPRAAGGSDYPSNLAAAHQSCNKRRGDRGVPDSLLDSVISSVNDSVNDARPNVPVVMPDSRPEGEGRGKGSRKGGDAREQVPPFRCPEHLGVPDAPPCRACGDARRAHDAWKLEQKNRPTLTAGAGELEECPDHQGQALEFCSSCAADRKASA